MPTPKLDDATIIEALNLVEEYGSAHLAAKAGATEIPANTLEHRVRQGRIRGLRPTFRKDEKRIYTRQRLGRMHLVIPDTQVRPHVRTDHLEWIGNYIVEKRPDVIVQIGDFADLPSLSVYSKGRVEGENQRYVKDLKAARDAMARLMRPIEDYNRTAKEKYTPELHLTSGNHEYRADRYAEEHPELEGFISSGQLAYQDWGWEVHPFLKVIKKDGIEYSHYFTSGVRGNAVSSAAALLRERQCSATMGHVQHTDIAMHKKTQQIAMFCGTCYLHDEKYLGQQDNCQRRQIIVKNEVEDGRYDPMFVSLRFLEKAYS